MKECLKCDHEDDKCGVRMLCDACHHWHDHAGCHECDCKICPNCKHVHGEHEGHEEGHEN